MPKRGVLSLMLLLACISIVHAEVVVETVTVGNPGNPMDTRYPVDGGVPGFGRVAYVYNIGKFEVNAGQYAEFLNAVAATDTYGLYNSNMESNDFGCQITQHNDSGSYTYDFSGRPSGTEADWVDRPVNYVSWGDAARFANWLHNGQPTAAQGPGTTEDGSYALNGATSRAALLLIVRAPDATWVIPSEDEWYKAAYNQNDGVSGIYYNYPTSSDSVPGYVNNSGDLSETGTLFTEGGTDPGNYATYDRDGGINGIGSPYYRTEVGEWENSESPYGTLDQGGNLFEWNETIRKPSARGLRGGSVDSYYSNMHAAYRSSLTPPGEGIYLGFRIAEVPQSKSDIDFDGDVDLDDYDLFQDMNLHDYALLQAAFTGPQ